ncbi:hypothetical protein A2375_02030 [Candidatus Woesebacteria bacterium RIFOXYB1_FULL_31_120]|nr:MAG: hypothetical protein A2375_02030 [Candidatus Woesebacteria bacterium RIFOXYB1_FULL_31_120]
MNEKIEVLPAATYSNKEAQIILGLGEDAIGRRIARGELKVSVLGNKYRFFGQDLIDYLKSQQTIK